MQFRMFKLSYVLSIVTATILLAIALPARAGSSVNSDRTHSTTATPSTVAQATGTIVDIAASNPSFTTLEQAIQAAGLGETLSGRGAFTVFAPTDEAFAALPSETLAALLRPENRDRLRQILTYHVVPGIVQSQDIQPGDVTTVEGSPVRLNVVNGQVTVNDATVQAADIQASNGVIHVIDRVILPPDL